MVKEETWTISGLSGGRPFVLNIWEAARVFRASAPRPYTVSVGNATHLRERRCCDARVSDERVLGDVISG